MNTKLLMSTSAILMIMIGLVLSFMPKEILSVLDITTTDLTMPLILQLTGALYFGFGIMNWMAKTVLIGGIYAKPLCIGNFAHFMIAALALIKNLMYNSTASKYIWILTIIYALLAIAFGLILMTNPGKKTTD
ncbi:hypothetical protein [Pedobacter montanisoli]|uniref:Uncharacterized protein n=1 Tax=Pedobacter montanisoli TaxID=2923277 RepID=A0ABS9ZW52_9SPHI|nr:hypothetical protein [Pedobacter montanisoli]MCJ0742532.1 hypothetical protein [Pedobacter montanisoli]